MGQVCSGEAGESNKAGAFADSDEYAKSGDLSDEALALQQRQLQQQQLLQQQQEQSAEDDHGSNLADGVGGGGGGMGASASAAEDAERLKALREEQARLELVVSTAGRGMVAVRSTRGSTGYYDQGFAAALAEFLEKTTQFPSSLKIRLPPVSKAKSGMSAAAVAAAANNSATSASGTSAAASSAASASAAASSSSSSSASATAGAASSSGANGTPSSNKKPNSVYERLIQPQWQGVQLGTGGGLAGCGGENPNRYMDNVAESLLASIVPAKQQLFAGAHPIVENLM